MVCDWKEKYIFLEADVYNRSRWKKRVRVEWVPREMDLNFESLGQAQYLILTPTKFPVATNIVGLFSPISDKLSHVSQRDFPTAGQHISVDIFQVSLTSLITDGCLSPTYLEDMHIELVHFDKHVECIEKMKSTLADSQNYLIEVVKLSKLLVRIGGNCSNGSMQLTNISILEMHPLVHRWELGGLKNYRWDPGGNKRDMGMQTTSAMEYQGNQTQQYYQGYQHVLFTFQQITNVVDNYGAFSMTFRVLKCPIIWVVKFKDVVRWLKRRNEIENKQLLFRCGEILNGKQGIRAESKVTTGNQCAHVGIGRGMYSINLRLKNVLLHCQLVAKIRSHKPPLLHNTWKAWLGKSSNGFKHSKSSECVKLENEFDIQDIGSMLLEFVMGRTTKKINDVEAFKDLLQAGKGVNKEPWKSNISWEIGKTYLAQAPKALMEICVEHLMVRLEFSRTQLWEALLKAWDPGELYSASCIVGKSCFKLWDPGGRVLIVVLYLHLEDKVNV